MQINFPQKPILVCLYALTAGTLLLCPDFVQATPTQEARSQARTGVPAQQPTSQKPCGLVPPILKEVAALRGLSPKSTVPCKVKNRSEVEASLKKLVKVKVPEERLALEALVYKTIGFIPKDFDYEKGLIDLYVSQLGGYYNPIERYFVMASWIPSALQVPVAAHELVHALQDQYYQLADFTAPDKFSSDELLARSALLEGDATALMLDYARKAAGQPPIAKERDISAILMQNLAGGGLSPSLRSVPQSLQLALFFPYTSGLRFAHELLRSGGYAAIDRAFARPPASTAEILHPELYLSSTPFVPYQFKSATSPAGCRVTHDETLGEFLISALLSQYANDKRKVSEAAKGWRGDTIEVTECEDKTRSVSWSIAWQSEKDRTEFLALMNLLGGRLSESQVDGYWVSLMQWNEGQG